MPEENKWIMAFDFGLSRIGVAVGNTLLKIPHPVVTITGKNKFEKFDKIRQLIDKWRPSFLVVGMPNHTNIPVNNDKIMDCQFKFNERQVAVGNDSASDDKTQLITNITRFANRLKQNFKLTVAFVNEDYTSSDASAKLTEQAVFGQKQKGKLDTLAACNILQRYFDEITSHAI